MSPDTMTVEVAIVVRQVNSPSGVIGKQLVNEPSGHNRFGLIMEFPDGTREGAIYRIQSALDGSGKMYRDHKADVDATDPTLKGAPTYKWEDLGNDFWMEQF